MNDLRSRKWWALGALALALLVVGLDGTVLSVALPTLSTALHASTGQLQWFVDAYLLVLAAALLPAGLLGDRFGRKKLLLAALAIFGVASLACAYASSTGMLVAARSVLGLSAAFLMPLSMAVLPVLFTPEERPRALGIWVTATAISFPIGPIVGGWLLDNFWWGSVFLINVPVVVLGLIAVSVLVPESRNPHPARLDVVGALTSSLGLAGITYGFIEAGEKGWGNAGALAVMAAGVVVLAAFVSWQRRFARRPQGQPLIDLGLFRSASFTWGTILATLMNFALFGLLFAMPQYFHSVNGTDALGTGLRLLPLIGGLVVGARVGGRLVPRAGAKVVVAIGFVLLAAGLVAGANTASGSGYALAATWLTIVGLGVGFAMPTALDAAIGALAAARSGVGSGLIQAVRQVGSAIGVAVLGTVLNSSYRGHLDVTGLPAQAAGAVRESVSAGVAVARQLGSLSLLDLVRSSFVHGMDAMLWVCAGLAVVGVILTLGLLPSRSEPIVGAGEARAESEREVIAGG
jgi:MFS transporter, DHA2 family, multidrug resistance protein